MCPEGGLLACSLQKLRLEKEAGRRILSVPQHPAGPLGGGWGGAGGMAVTKVL